MNVTVLIPPNTLPRIEKIWAYLSVDDEGKEGVCAAPIGPGGMCVPMIAADPARLESLSAIAEQLAAYTGMKLVLVEFATRADVRTINGKSS